MQTEDLHIHTQHCRLRPWCYRPTDTQQCRLRTYRYTHTHSTADCAPGATHLQTHNTETEDMQVHTHTAQQTAPLVLQTYRHAAMQTEDMQVHTQHCRLRP